MCRDCGCGLPGEEAISAHEHEHGHAHDHHHHPAHAHDHPHPHDHHHHHDHAHDHGHEQHHHHDDDDDRVHEPGGEQISSGTTLLSPSRGHSQSAEEAKWEARRTIEVRQALLAKNDRLAER